MNVRGWTSAGLLLAVVSGGLAACKRAEAPAPAPRPVVVMRVEAGGAQQVALYSGEVRARQEGDLAFRIGGKVVERRVNLGDTVQRGQVLARLDPQDAQLAARAAGEAVRAAEADVSLARAEFERAENLSRQGFISGSALDARRTQLAAAEARLKQARDSASVQQNQAGYTELVAGRSGVVTSLGFEVGQVVAAGQPVLRLADPAAREALIWVPESRIARLRTGDAALVRPWNAQELTLPGRVREIAAAADPVTRTYAVRVAVPGADARMPLGSTVGVGFVKEAGTTLTPADTLVRLPLPAVLQRDGQASVWVLGADNTASARAVEVAAFRDHEALIMSGLKDGERVVVVGAHAVQPGLVLRAVEQSAPVALDVLR